MKGIANQVLNSNILVFIKIATKLNCSVLLGEIRLFCLIICSVNQKEAESYYTNCDEHLFGQFSTHTQVVLNCRFSVAQMCTWEDIHAGLFTLAVLDDVMSQSELTTMVLDESFGVFYF